MEDNLTLGGATYPISKKCTRGLYNLINQCHPKKFNKKNRKET